MKLSAYLGLMLLALGGCAWFKKTGATPAPQVKLAVLPVESDAFPEVARRLNEVLIEGTAPGVDVNFRARVTLEVVQLSIECVEPSNTCYAAAGRSLGAQRLLFAQLLPGAGRRRDKPVTVTVTYFDVVRQVPLRVVERAFKQGSEAVKAAPELVSEALSPDTGGVKKADAR